MAKVDEFSYASEEDGVFKRSVIQIIERMSGQPKLKRLYLEHQNDPKPGESFWNAAVRKLELQVEFNRDALAQIPKEGRCIIVANHPFGVLDGIVACWLVSQIRDDFKILTNALLNRAQEIKPYLLPIDFEESKEALETNLKSRAESKALLDKGGVLIIFPGGTVSTTPTVLARKAKDPEWKNFTAKMILQGKAPVVPIFFAGQNSRLFQVASHLSMTLRLSLLFREVHDRIGGSLQFRIGQRIPYEELSLIKDRTKLMEFLREKTYALDTAELDRPRRRRKTG